MKKIFSFFAAILFAGSMMAGTFTLTNANIVAAGNANTGYAKWAITDDASLTWNAYAIKNKHSKATAANHFLQIKKYDSSKSEAYYIQIPNLGENIQSITMTVSNTSQPMDGGGNKTTVYFSALESTSAEGAGVASGTGASSITIDASELALQTGYITAGGAVRIWDITVTTAAAPAVAKPTIAGNTEFEDEVEVTITAAAGATIYYTLDGTDPTDASTEYTTAFTLNETKTVKAIAKVGTDVSYIATKVFTKLEELNCAGFAALEDNAKGLLDEFVVTYAAADGKNIWIKDASGALLIYYSAGSYGLKAGDVVKGMKGSKTSYQTKVAELVPSVAKTELNITEGAAPEPEELAVAPEETDINKYVVFKTVEAVGSFTEGTASNIKIKIAGTDVTFRSNFKNAYTFVSGKKYDIVGLVSYYGSAIQVNFVSATESTPTAIDNTEAGVKATKVLRDGVLLIEKNGVLYNAQGAVVR